MSLWIKKRRSTPGQKVCAPQKSNTTCEKLTHDDVKRLVGHEQIVYYNFDTKAWNTNKYNGYKITQQELDTELAEMFKEAMEKIPQFAECYEMVASMTMTIHPRCYTAWGKKIFNPKYYRYSKALVGNIIVKDKKTGKFSLYCPSWICNHYYDYYEDAAINGPFNFACEGAHNSDLRDALMLAHER